MLLWENLKMALVSLRNAKLRSFLTMLGIIIGVAAVVSILAIGAGVKKAVQDQITGVVNANSIAIASGKVGPQAGKNGQNPGASAAGASTLTLKDVDALKTVDNINAVAPIGLISGIVANGSTTAGGALLLATSPEYSKTQTLKYDAGRFFNATETKKNVVVLGGKAKESLFGTKEAVGQTVTIRGQKFEVIGALKPSDASASALAGPSFDDAVYIPFDTAAKLTGGTAQVLRIIAQVEDGADVNTTAERAREALLASHGGQDDFSVLTQKDILSTVDTILNLLTTFIVAIASISLLVGGIGIMNIMLVSVTERTREIGLRKAVGASSTTVLMQFLIEALVISIIGGALGIGAAMLMATAAGRLAKIEPVFTPEAILLAVGVSAAVGIIFGIAPAIKAARKRPIQALKAV
jgi:ABC-type antimicrobial peptide transport system permease subunit